MKKKENNFHLKYLSRLLTGKWVTCNGSGKWSASHYEAGLTIYNMINDARKNKDVLVITPLKPKGYCIHIVPEKRIKHSYSTGGKTCQAKSQ